MNTTSAFAAVAAMAASLPSGGYGAPAYVTNRNPWQGNGRGGGNGAKAYMPRRRRAVSNPSHPNHKAYLKREKRRRERRV